MFIFYNEIVFKIITRHARKLAVDFQNGLIVLKFTLQKMHVLTNDKRSIVSFSYLSFNSIAHLLNLILKRF